MTYRRLARRRHLRLLCEERRVVIADGKAACVGKSSPGAARAEDPSPPARR